MSTAVVQLQSITSIQCYKVHCCENQCIAFTGNYIDLNQCPCRSQQFYENGVILRYWFLYILLAIQLVIQYTNKKRAEILTSYHARFDQEKESSELQDFWDCWLYKEFFCQWLGCFWDEHDVRLHLSLDGVQIVMNKSHEVTPILLYNLNLLPDLWYKTKNILIFAILLGPNQPGDLNSFCSPLMNELKYLDENGVQVYDAK